MILHSAQCQQVSTCVFEVEEAKKEMKNRKDFWLHTNIVVKIITKKLGEKYYKKKAVVKVDIFCFILFLFVCFSI